MNNITRPLVYFSLVTAFSALAVNAAPFSTPSGYKDGGSAHANQSSDILSTVSEVTRSGFSEFALTEDQTSGHAASTADAGPSAITASRGKLVGISNLDNTHFAAPQQNVESELASHDSIGVALISGGSDAATKHSSPSDSSTGSGSASVPGDQSNSPVVKEPSAVITEALDPSTVLDTPTTTSDSSSTTSSPLSFGTVSDASISPEPSTIVLVGSMFLAFGIYRKTRRQRV